eukprot:symbB.v1.2.026814.t1/scaffold2712.1/size72561/3
MSALHREAKWQKCLEIFHGFPLARLQPDTFFCNQWQITTSELIRGPIVASGIGYDNLLQSCAEETQWAAALAHCCATGGHRVNPSVVGHTSVVAAFARDSQWSKAFSWPQHMMGRSIEANVVTLNNLISACQQSDLSLWFAALSLISSSLDIGLKLSAVTFSTTLSGISATCWPWTLELLSMAHASVGDNLYCINSALASINWMMILRLLQEMCSFQILPDTVSSNTFFAASPWRQSILTSQQPGRNLFRSCSSNWRLALLSRDAPFVARVMETFGQWQRALAILADVTGGIGTEPCDLILNCAIRACAEAHHWQVSVAVLMSTSLATEISFNSAIGACAKLLQWQVAIRLFEVMKLQGLVPNAVTYGSVLAASKDDWGTSLHLLRCMSEASIRRDAFAYCSAVNACCRGQPWQLALLFHPNQQLEGHEVLCSTLIVACAEGAPQQDGCAAWCSAVAMLINRPTLLATNSVLKAISHDCDQSLSIFAWSPESCRDVTTYSLFLMACEMSLSPSLASSKWQELQRSATEGLRTKH